MLLNGQQIVAILGNQISPSHRIETPEAVYQGKYQGQEGVTLGTV